MFVSYTIISIYIRFVALEFKITKNMYITRVKSTVKNYLDTSRFGMKEYSRHDRLKALHSLTQNGLKRNDSNFCIIKPLLHAMSLEKETVNMLQKRQRNNMSNYMKDAEFALLNGRLLGDCMKPSEVAMLILVIENNMTIQEDVSRN